MSEITNQDIMRTVIEEAFNKENYAVLERLFAGDYKENQFGLKPTVEGMKKDIHYLHMVFPDFHLEIEDMVSDGECVWARSTGRGTDLGGFMGKATGKKIEITVMDVVRIENGKIVEHWGAPDRFAALSQLGLLPVPQGTSV